MYVPALMGGDGRRVGHVHSTLLFEGNCIPLVGVGRSFCV